MADIAADDVTYTLIKQSKLSDSRSMNLVRLAFGDGSLTVPANGIPLTKGKLGCPTVVESLLVVDQGTSGYRFQYDQSAEKLVVIQSPSHAHDLLVVGGGTIVTNGAFGVDSGTQFVKVAATNTTIVGANSATKGGVLSSTALAASEAATVAIAAQTIEVEVIGW